MVDAFYREALNKQGKLRADFLSKRSALEQVVGVETLLQFEENLEKRANLDNKKWWSVGDSNS